MFEEQIERGVAVLDNIKPQWYHHVDLDLLDLNHCYQCVTGQLFGEFTKGMNEILAALDVFENKWKFAEEHGFSVPEDPNIPGWDVATTTKDIEGKYGLLTAEWRATIIRLREERRHGRDRPE